jgi:hypothetical protein
MSTEPASRSDSLPRFGRGAALALALGFLLLGVAFTAPLVRHLHDGLPYAAVPTAGRELVYGAQGDYLQFYYYLLLPVARPGPPPGRGVHPAGPLPVRRRRAPAEPPEHLPAGRAPLRSALRPRSAVRLQRPSFSCHSRSPASPRRSSRGATAYRGPGPPSPERSSPAGPTGSGPCSGATPPASRIRWSHWCCGGSRVP